jgi:DNA-binding transcriptional regulator YiaG
MALLGARILPRLRDAGFASGVVAHPQQAGHGMKVGAKSGSTFRSCWLENGIRDSRMLARRTKPEESPMSRVIKRQRASKSEIALPLARWRKRNKRSQSQAALKLKISPRTFQEWEQGRATPRHVALEALLQKIAR